MSGFQLGEAAKRIRPDLRILYTSGFSEAALNNGIAASVGREDILLLILSISAYDAAPTSAAQRIPS